MNPESEARRLAGELCREKGAPLGAHCFWSCYSDFTILAVQLGPGRVAWRICYRSGAKVDGESPNLELAHRDTIRSLFRQ